MIIGQNPYSNQNIAFQSSKTKGLVQNIRRAGNEIKAAAKRAVTPNPELDRAHKIWEKRGSDLLHGRLKPGKLREIEY